MKNVERVETLTQLGLTLNQARAYLALTLFGPSGAKSLSETSKITRQDIYRVMISLEETGIIEKLIGKPTIYKATPIRQAARILLERKIAEQRELQKRTHRLVQSLENNHEGKVKEQTETQFIMIPGKEVIMQRLGEALQKTTETLEVVTAMERFSPAIIGFKEGYANALGRGVKIKIATEETVIQRPVLNTLRHLMKKGSFEVRSFVEAPEAVVSIFDGKEASVTLTDTANTSKAAALWSNDASFVALARNYFKSKWNGSTEIGYKLTMPQELFRLSEMREPQRQR